MKIKNFKIDSKEFSKWRKKYWREIDIMIYGNAYEDEKGNRVDPMDVYVKTEDGNNPEFILRKNENQSKNN